MRILDRYINKSIFKIFFSAIFVFCLIYIVVDVTSQLDEFIERKVPVSVLINYYLSYLPIIIKETSSIACLIATMLTFSGMQNHNEIIAMRASGLNFWQITKPALFFGLLIAATVFWMNESIIPKANQITKKIRHESMESAAYYRIKGKSKISNLTFYGLKNRLYYVETYHPSTSELEGITIVEHDDKLNPMQKIVALKGKWTGIAWKFYQCQVTIFDKSGFPKPLKVKYYNEKLMDIKETPEDFLKQELKVDSMNIHQLNEYINRFASSGATSALNKLRVDLHQKMSYPIGNFVIVLVGLPFALMIKQRKGLTFTALGLAFVIGFLYYVVNAVALALGKGGLFPPFISAWMTPVFFAGTAIAVIENKF